MVASASAFTVVKLAGAAYLVYLRISALRGRSSSFAMPADAPARSHRRIFTDGVVLNILNPKSAVFFLAFVPQFVVVDAGNATTQVIALGSLFVLIGLVTDGLYAFAAGAIGRRLRRSPSAAHRSETAAGVIYLGLGATTALSGSSA